VLVNGTPWPFKVNDGCVELWTPIVWSLRESSSYQHWLFSSCKHVSSLSVFTFVCFSTQIPSMLCFLSFIMWRLLFRFLSFFVLLLYSFLLCFILALYLFLVVSAFFCPCSLKFQLILGSRNFSDSCRKQVEVTKIISVLLNSLYLSQFACFLQTIRGSNPWFSWCTVMQLNRLTL